MIDRNYSALTMKKRVRRRDWRAVAIAVALIAGVVLVAVAFIFRDETGDIPDAPQARSITDHESTNGVDLVAVEREDAVVDPNAATAPAAGDDSAPGSSKNADLPGRPKLPNAQRLPDPLGDNTRQAQAMADLARMPSRDGGVAPKLGHFRIQQTDIVYDAAAKPEDILRDQASRYTVVSGDILGRIAQKHGCTIEQIQKANKMTDDKIKIGQKILIPNCSEPEPQPNSQLN